jgi:enoyl-CoA hydratase
MSLVNFEREGFTGIITINRPEALNALNSDVIAELSAVLDEAAALVCGAPTLASGIRSLIVRGAGEKAFVAGADISEMKDLSPQEAEKFSAAGREAMDKVELFPVPVIAAVSGFALGGGCELALACDIRLASEKASFAFPEVSLGILPGYGGIRRLVRLVGPGRAKELLFTARRIKAEEALSCGLVNGVYPASELETLALKLAAQINENAPVGVRGAKEAANNSPYIGLAESNSLEIKLFGKCFETQDQRGAMSAFVEKRKPEPFTGK